MGENELRSAPHARLSTATVRLKFFGESSSLAPGVAIIAEARASCLDRFPEYRDNLPMKWSDFIGGERTSGARRVDARAPQRLIGEDVSNSRDLSLIHQDLLYRLTRTPNNAR
jgi:hypothetical protein